jgi:hypothetical protein
MTPPLNDDEDGDNDNMMGNSLLYMSTETDELVMTAGEKVPKLF